MISPHPDLAPSILPRFCSEGEGNEEEERRLCYVGMTRAKDRLTMIWPAERRSLGAREGYEPTCMSHYMQSIVEAVGRRQLLGVSMRGFDDDHQRRNRRFR